MIDSPGNTVVKHLRSLATAKGRREHGEFLVEGVRLLDDGLRTGLRPRVCIYDAEALSKTERGRNLLRLLERLRDDKQSIFEASPRAIAAAADTQHSQGVVASFAIRSWAAPTATDAPLALVCDNIQDPGNLGTILRTAEAAGVLGVWLLPDCVDMYHPKVVRAAMGAHFRLPTFAERPSTKLLLELEALGIARQHIYATEAVASLTYDTVDWRVPSALVVSNEAHGLSAEASALVANGARLAIPMHGGTESLNAAIAAAVVLFEAARQRRLGESPMP